MQELDLREKNEKEWGERGRGWGVTGNVDGGDNVVYSESFRGASVDDE
jgi:hypothetical protein